MQQVFVFFAGDSFDAGVTMLPPPREGRSEDVFFCCCMTGGCVVAAFPVGSNEA